MQPLSCINIRINRMNYRQLEYLIIFPTARVTILS